MINPNLLDNYDFDKVFLGRKSDELEELLESINDYVYSLGLMPSDRSNGYSWKKFNTWDIIEKGKLAESLIGSPQEQNVYSDVIFISVHRESLVELKSKLNKEFSKFKYDFGPSRTKEDFKLCKEKSLKIFKEFDWAYPGQVKRLVSDRY